MRATPDLGDRHDLDVLLRRFYGAAFADPLIGPFFTELAGTDLEAHLPHIAGFWERALFRTGGYGRDAFAPHAALHTARPLTAAHFGRWVQLWRASVDGLHRGRRRSGPRRRGAGRARDAAAARRGRGGHRGDGRGFVPLAALELRSVGRAKRIPGER
ncbi:group III truncated hemoglobin [Streptomyces diastatochromogenes]|nr:group III truncated hemoglobin [Streptomyces diastatochromogenes]